jgi:hypothetical protein
MKIGIAIDGVLRSFMHQLHYTYEKYMKELDFEPEDVDSFDLLKFYEFKDKLALNEFLYKQASLEIFGHADQAFDNVFVNLNDFLVEIEDETNHEIVLIERGVGSSIPATFFFLSKTLCKAENIKFVREYEDMWEHVDALIASNPITLKAKPDDKLGIKINQSYNKDVEVDYEFDNPIDIMDVDVLDKLIKGDDYS